MTPLIRVSCYTPSKHGFDEKVGRLYLGVRDSGQAHKFPSLGNDTVFDTIYNYLEERDVRGYDLLWQ